MKLFRTALTYVSKATLLVALVWLLMFLVDYVGTYFHDGQQPDYETQPEYLKLKASPEDVVYSIRRKNKLGEEEVQYAYMAEEVSPILDEDLQRRTPNSQTQVLAVKEEEGKKIETLKTTFYSKPQLFKDGEGKWRQVEYATTTPEVFSMSGAVPYLKRRELAERLLPGESAFALTGGPYYPQPNTETVSVDGYVGYDSSTSWADAYGATTGGYQNDSATTLTVSSSYYQDDSCPYSGCYYDVWSIIRSAILFDTSSLPDSININSATVNVYVTAKNNFDNDGDDTFNLVTSAPAANTAVGTADYNDFGSTLQASALDITSMTTSAYNTFTLNSTGLSSISKTGVTKFGLREGHDLGNTVPAYGIYYSIHDNAVGMYSADQTGTSQDPKLDVTYELVTFSMGQWFPF